MLEICVHPDLSSDVRRGAVAKGESGAMAEFYYRDISGGPGRAMGPFADVDEAKRAARYKGLLKVEILKKAGAGFETVEGAGTPKPAGANGGGGPSPSRP
jgi:hypothetical protein